MLSFYGDLEEAGPESPPFASAAQEAGEISHGNMFGRLRSLQLTSSFRGATEI